MGGRCVRYMRTHRPCLALYVTAPEEGRRAAPAPSRPGLLSGGLAHQADHDPEDFEGGLGADDRIGLVLWAQDELAAVEIEALERELVVDDGHHDIAAARGTALFDDD